MKLTKKEQYLHDCDDVIRLAKCCKRDCLEDNDMKPITFSCSTEEGMLLFTTHKSDSRHIVLTANTLLKKLL